MLGSSWRWPTRKRIAAIARTWCHRKAVPLTVNSQSASGESSPPLTARPGTGATSNERIRRSNDWTDGSILQKLRKSCWPTSSAAASRILATSSAPRTKQYLYVRCVAEKRAEKLGSTGCHASTRMSAGSTQLSLCA